MKYGHDDIDRIVGFSTWNEKKKLDELFRIDTWMYTNLGTDSTKTEKEAVRKKSRAIYRAINKINPSIGKNFLYHMDE